MGEYEQQVLKELSDWQHKMQASPSLLNRMSKGLQNRVNRVIPEKVHNVITTAIKQMLRGVLEGASFTTAEPLEGLDLYTREQEVRRKVQFYRNTSSAEGAITGAGGLLLGLADFPIWLSLKMKMLFDIAGLYGYSVKDYRERVFILHIFQLTFSSQAHRNNIYKIIENWEQYKNQMPMDIHEFDWRSFQQEYRDYIDLAKLLQLVPGIGAVVGAYVNHKLTQKLGDFAMQAYRMRKDHDLIDLSSSAKQLSRS